MNHKIDIPIDFERQISDYQKSEYIEGTGYIVITHFFEMVNDEHKNKEIEFINEFYKKYPENPIQWQVGSYYKSEDIKIIAQGSSWEELNMYTNGRYGHRI